MHGLSPQGGPLPSARAVGTSLLRGEKFSRPQPSLSLITYGQVHRLYRKSSRDCSELLACGPRILPDVSLLYCSEYSHVSPAVSLGLWEEGR